MRKPFYILPLIFLIVFSTCAATIKLKVLHSSDIHGFLDHDYHSKNGGFLQLGTVLRKEYNKSDTLLIDCGDIAQGSFTTMLSSGMAAVAALNSLGYDVWVPGNHEYDFGIAPFEAMRTAFKGRFLAANLELPQDRRCAGYHIFERQGVKIAVIGITRARQRINRPDDNAAVKVLPALESLRRVMPEIMDKNPQIIILAIHEGLYSGNKAVFKCIREFPQINLVLGAHTHQLMTGRKISFNSWYTEPGCHGNQAVKINISYDTEQWRITALSSQALLVPEDTPDDKQTLLDTKPWRENAAQAAQKIIGKSLFDIKPATKRTESSSAGKLIGRALREAAGTEAAFAAAQNHYTLKAGTINFHQLFRFCPYENQIVTLKLNERELRKIVAEQYHVARQRKRARFLQVSGIVNNVEKGVINGPIRFESGREWKDKKTRIKFAFISYSLCGEIYYYPELLEIARKPEAHYRNTKIPLRGAIADYIKKHSPLNIGK